MVTRTQHYKN